MSTRPARQPADESVETGVCSDIGRVRQKNMDAVLVVPPVFAVADGMGGMPAGEVASNLALESIKFQLTRPPRTAAELRQALETANRDVLAAAEQKPEWLGMGTTLTALVIQPTRTLIAHIGDSRAYLLRGGRLKQLTADHSYVAELVRQGQLTAGEARLHPHRNMLTRALGNQPEIAVDTGSHPLKPGDALILCTDGLTGLLSDGEIAETADRAPSAQAAAERLVEAANARGGPDNITAVVVRLGGAT
ncbi:MAG TPA: Stp1/IreP family PP2C-type Ser/Thr phosphatase [Limnochordia bacterium]|nr:Stp1/IreP family PP2C-type Ser/Thr phosphatase [Limnochordia bacterium]